MKTKKKKKVAVAKSTANTERNRAKSQARFTKANAPRRENGSILLGFVPGTTMAPVLDLCRFGGPERKRVLRPVTLGRGSTNATRPHNAVSAAFKAAGL
jgi:hypothetical protein